MKLRINPLDTLFFRDGKPFNMGDDAWADGIFPPYPSVIYGGIRTWYLANQIAGFTEQTIKLSEAINIQHIHYQVENTIHLPLPLDLVQASKSPKEEYAEEQAKSYAVVKLSLSKATKPISNYPLPCLLLPPSETRVETVEDGLISMDDFQNYLQGNLQETQIKKIKDYIITEPKIGIGRNNHTHAAEQSMLYRVGMRRIQDFNILVECTKIPEIDPTIQSSLLRFGAEGKVVAFEDSKARMGLRTNSVQLNPADQTFKLYLSTPAIFKTGWKPDLEKKFGIKADLVAAVVGKPLHIGGFDMVKREPKTMYKAVPAGSVYYYKVTEGYELVEEKLQGKAISDVLKTQGFGIAYVGNY